MPASGIDPALDDVGHVEAKRLGEAAARAVGAFTELTREYPDGPLVMVSHDACNTALLKMFDPTLDGVTQRTACYNQISRREERWPVDFYDRKPQ